MALHPPLKMKQKNLFLLTITLLPSSDVEKRQNVTNEKFYLRIPTSVDAIIFTMQNGKYNAVLLTKIVLKDFTIYILHLRKLKSHYICQE